MKKFKIGDLVRRKPETVFHPEDYPPFFVMFIMENKKAAGGYMYSEDNKNWVAQDVLEIKQ